MKAIDDGLRVVGVWKHAPVGFRLERDAALGEPVDRVLWLPAMKGAAQLARAAWIMSGELGGIEATVGDITAAPARDFHFTQRVLAALVEGDVRSRICFGCGDGRKKTSRRRHR